MRPAWRDRAIPAALAVGSMVLAVCQRPGTLVTETKVNLHTDPGAFLGAVTSNWSSTADLGHVWAGQYGGYVFPMAPWFALGHWLGIPMWLVDRLWLGLLLALAAWGVVRLLDALSDRPRGVLHLVAGVLFVVNPYVTVYANRISVALLAYAALPWLLLCVHRGLRDPRSWAWPAAFAVALTCTGGGVNAAVTAWVLVGPLLFVIYERMAGGIGRGALRPFLARMAVTNLLASAWWIVPVLVAARYGTDFLPYTEQPGTIWSVSSLPESLRLMGFWTSYIGSGFGGVLRPYASFGHAFLFHPPIIVASLLVPALAIGGFAWTRRWRYGAWFLLITLVGVLIMSAGFPEGTPLRRGLTFTYNHVHTVQFLRTTYKAGPLAALGLACLGGGAFAELWHRRSAAGWRVATAVVAAGLIALAAWPLATGRAPERQLALPHGVPAAWTDEAHLLDRRGDATRAISLPGQAFSYYRWGGTVDHIVTGLTEHPVATRYIVPFSDLRADDLQWATDALITQERALPGQLPSLLDLLGIGDVLLASDGDRDRSGELGASAAADVLADQGLLRPPTPDAHACGQGPGAGCDWRNGGHVTAGPASRGLTSFGPRLAVASVSGRPEDTAHLPQVTDIKTPTAGLVRLLPRGPVTVIDGAAEGIVDLAAFGALRPDAPLAYAADLGPARLRVLAGTGANFVVSDSNRRQAFISARLRGNHGYVLTPGQDVAANGVILDPFPEAGTNAQTVAQLRGVKSVWAPFSPQVTQFPEHRPFAALDGNLDTAWIADRYLEPIRHYLRVTFTAPRDVASIELYPYSDARGVVKHVLINERERFAVHPGWNHLRLGLHHVSSLTVQNVDVARPKDKNAGGGGIRELRIPGVSVTERLRSPVLVDDALTGHDTSRSGLTYLFTRFTADAPAWRAGRGGAYEAGVLRDQRDPEPQLARLFDLPARRSFVPDAWVRARQDAPDDRFDLLAGASGGVRATGSERYEGAPAYRASSALDGRPGTQWVGEWIGGLRPWLQWQTARPRAVGSLRLVPAATRMRHPTSVRLTVDGRRTPPLPVAADGTVTPPPRLRGRTVRLEVLRASFPRGTSRHDRHRRSVAIAEIVGAPRMHVPVQGPFRSGCLTLATVDGRPLRLRASGDLRDLDADGALRARPCGSALSLGAGRHELLGRSAALVVDALRLRSPPVAPLAAPVAPGRVLSAGSLGHGERDHVRLDVTQPAWLVLGEAFDRGWEASCDGRSLGAPQPLQGYANAWRVAPGCRSVAFSFGPDRLLWPFYLLSLLASLAFVVIVARSRRRLAAQRLTTIAPRPVPDGAARPWTLPTVAGAAVATFLVVGFVFALRAGAIAAPVVAALLYLRVSSTRLLLVALGVLGVVVPVLYLAYPGRDPGGYSTYYGASHLAAHWITVGAIILVGLALARTLVAARRSRRPSGG